MRSGRLLAEESPSALLTMYNCPSLEDVFLKLSRKQGQFGQPTAELNISNNISLVSENRVILNRCLLKFIEFVQFHRKDSDSNDNEVSGR